MPLRSVLFAPAVKPDLIEKLPRWGADAVVIDCEDATPPDRKEEAREIAHRVGGSIAGSVPVWIRVNGLESGLFAEDVRRAVPDGAAGIVVPMVESDIQLDSVRSTLARVGRSGLGVMVGVETARGVAGAREFLTHSVVTAAYFGAEDFAADMGGIRTESNAEVHHARSEVALAGRVAEVPVLDMVVVDFSDGARFRREASEARAMGFAGKLCIHPSQVPLAVEAFTPSAEEVDAARRIVDAHRDAVESGTGVAVVDGRMIDAPLVARAQRVIDSVG